MGTPIIKAFHPRHLRSGTGARGLAQSAAATAIRAEGKGSKGDLSAPLAADTLKRASSGRITAHWEGTLPANWTQERPALRSAPQPVPGALLVSLERRLEVAGL